VVGIAWVVLEQVYCNLLNIFVDYSTHLDSSVSRHWSPRA